ncbi:hypothetical protein V1L54_15970 [Streptomyces sp. TRM 70361]|uniref:hypothetical protein n=1 Tax=Streptomyces sp. TRM 70361 TaxID=3116553 RepID=UPI002E7B2909|nr:hypothetical protein [Streptomyces sp. TRM 70361]MEE1940883.1 hypothetical protein [Streptomyces sp. TRM 70361]
MASHTGAPAHTPVLGHLLRRTLEQTLIPSPNVVELAPGGSAGFVNRVAPAQDDVAELFHLNSRLSRHRPDDRLTAAEREGVRRWFFTTCGRHRPEDFTGPSNEVRRPHAELPAPLGALCAPFGGSGPLTGLLYGCDLMVVTGDALCRQQPGEDALWVERRLDGGPAALAPAMPDPGPAEALRGARAALVLTGVPWRSMLGSGPRGYRHMLMDAGVLLDVVCGLARQAGYEALPVRDFYDDELDTLLHCDGLERSALAVVALRRPTDGAADGAPDDTRGDAAGGTAGGASDGTAGDEGGAA